MSGSSKFLANFVATNFVPDVPLKLESPIRDGQLIVNLRAESPPDVLGQTVREGLGSAAKSFPTLKATLEYLEHFRPGRPTRIGTCARASDRP